MDICICRLLPPAFWRHRWHALTVHPTEACARSGLRLFQKSKNQYCLRSSFLPASWCLISALNTPEVLEGRPATKAEYLRVVCPLPMERGRSAGTALAQMLVSSCPSWTAILRA
eukprot:6180281-Pleurochrysis_carterae.AAC.2